MTTAKTLLIIITSVIALILYACNKKTSEQVVLDSIPNANIEMVLSPDKKRLAFVDYTTGLIGNNIVVKNKFVVLDGKKGKGYQDIYNIPPVFSPDSRHLLYVAIEGGKQFVVVDGQEGNKYDAIGTTDISFFSPDSQRIAYSAHDGEKWFVVVDGVEHKKYDGIYTGTPFFTPDSKHIIYVAYEKNSNKSRIIVMDDKEIKRYDDIGNIVISPDGSKLAFLAVTKEKGRWFVVIGDKEYGLQYKGFKAILFSPDSNHFAYIAQGEDDKWLVVRDEKESRHYDDIDAFTLRVSPDSSKLAYVAKIGEKWTVVIDDKEFGEYAKVHGIVFSSDSKTIAYKASTGTSDFLVVNGKEGPKYNFVGDPVLSPDSKHIAYFASNGIKSLLILDGKEIQHDDSALIDNTKLSGWQGTISFDKDNSIHYLVMKKQEVMKIFLIKRRLNF